MHPAFFVFLSSIPSLLPPVKRIFYLPPEIFHGRMYAPPVFGQTEAVSQIRMEGASMSGKNQQNQNQQNQNQQKQNKQNQNQNQNQQEQQNQNRR